MSRHEIETLGVIGAGGFGSIIPEYFAPKHTDVIMYDRREDALYPDGAQKVSLFDVLKYSDAIMLAVPYPYGDLLDEVAGTVSPETLLVDVCSVKMLPTFDFKKAGLFDRLEVLMTHPLVGPSTVYHKPKRGLIGRKIAITSDEFQHGPKANELIKCWEDRQALIVPKTPEEHDKWMAKHALAFYAGEILLRDDGFLGDLSDAPTPTVEKLIGFESTIKDHSQELFDVVVKYNPFAAPARLQYALTALRVNRDIDVLPLPFGEDSTPEQINEQFQNFRKLLDNLDKMLPIILSTRFNYTDGIGEIKQAADLPARNLEREEQIIKQLREDSLAQGLSIKVVRALEFLYRVVMDEVVDQNIVRYGLSELDSQSPSHSVDRFGLNRDALEA